MRVLACLAVAAAVVLPAGGAEAASTSLRERLTFGSAARGANNGFMVPAFYPGDNTDQLFGGATQKVEQGEGAPGQQTPETLSNDSGFPVAKPDAFNPPAFDKLLAGLPMSISPDTRLLMEGEKLNSIVEAVHENNMKLHAQLCTSDTCPQRVSQIRPDIHVKDAARAEDAIQRKYEEVVEERRQRDVKAAREEAKKKRNN